ncbi:hypothetical protein [Pseudomonas sp. zfem005]|uniref:hypothetical protein n=1 Tax=Pseudomonas sp. zfem005 TaxID=3078200 RepID=UPI00292A1E76|nr:hypothetical protein [Pseudomonas sp. zfem005]MDU9416315.1 hypothetical protein [Pseudomonas sp. zfem005]
MKNWIATFFRIVRDDKGQTQGYPIPWAIERPSLYAFLAAYADSPEGLPDSELTLPDEAPPGTGSELRWAPGALDGVLGHHASADDVDTADEVMAALLATLDDPTRHMARLYQLVADGSVLGFIDQLVERLQQRPGLPRARLHALALWLARSSPDRGAVKFALALLGVLDSGSQRELFLTFGQHEEFTLFATIALGHTLAPPERERAWWALARKVRGWGRIHLVERLAENPSPAVQDWLLREGYQNSVMVEYLAYPCAVGGNLLAALSGQDVDDALLDGAVEMIEALINGGPARDINDYADGTEAVLHLLDHLARRPPRHLGHFLAVEGILDFVRDPNQDWDGLAGHGWTQASRDDIARRAEAIRNDPHWSALVHAGLEQEEERAFWLAAHAGKRLDIDPWDAWYERQRSERSSAWYQLMQTSDPQRIARVIDLARQQLDLEHIASGPSNALGLGPEYRQHSALDFILQDLGRFPVQGWDLVATGLASPVVRNRHMALKALAAWGRNQWPADALQLLRRTLDREPEQSVRDRIAELLQPQLVEAPPRDAD